jgi:hypothetical protein
VERIGDVTVHAGTVQGPDAGFGRFEYEGRELLCREEPIPPTFNPELKGDAR